MSLNTKPTLSAIPAFDAEFGTSGKEHISAPVLKFSWRDGMARKNRVVIRDYDSNDVVYDCTIVTMALKHQLHNLLDTSEKTQVVTYNLQNGHKYIANVYVYTELGGEPSLPSNDIIFYCFATPTFRFINFDKYLSDSSVAVVENNSINLRVKYSQTDGEVLNYYNFILRDPNNSELIKSYTKYGSEAEDILRYTIGGIEETVTDKYGDILPNQYYTIICTGETAHGMVITAEQKFVVLLDNHGVGASLIVKNIGDGTVSITSNYRIINSHCSVENPLYELNDDGEPYAISLTGEEYVEFLDGFMMKNPYEVIFSGKFNLGELVRFQNADGQTASINFCKYTFTDPDLYYVNFVIERGDIYYEIRTNYFSINVEPSSVLEGVLILSDKNAVIKDNVLTLSNADVSGTTLRLYDSLDNMKIDLSYKNGYYNIKAMVNGEVY